MDYISLLTSSLPPWDRLKHERQWLTIGAATSLLLYSTYKIVSSTRDPWRKRKGGREIPVPDSNYPVVGHLLSLGKKPTETLARWHKKYGPLLRLKMGVQNWIVVSDPELAHKIFVVNGQHTSGRPYTVYTYKYYGMNGRGILASQPGEWFKTSRAAVLTVLAPKNIAKYSSKLSYEADEMLNRILTRSQTGFINPLRELHLTSLNVVLQLTCNRRINSVDDPLYVEIMDIVLQSGQFAAPNKDFGNFLPFLAFLELFVGYQREMRSFIYDRRNPLYRDLIKDVLSTEQDNLLVNLRKSGFEMDEDFELVLITDFIHGGATTVSVSIGWIIAILGNHPDTLARVRQELDQSIKTLGRVPTLQEKEMTPFCNSVIKECLRFRPISPYGSPHVTSDDIEVDGYVIPKGSALVSSMHAMHDSHDNFKDADQFIPDRYLDRTKSMMAAANGKLEDRDHYNFGWGRRLCPGIHLAETEIYNAFTRLFSQCNFEFEGGPPDISEYANCGLIYSCKPYNFKCTKRSVS